MLYKVVLRFESVDEILKCDHSNESYWAQYFPEELFITLYKVVLSFESVDEILKCDYSNESYWAVLSCGAVYYAVQGGSNVWVCRWNAKQWYLNETEQYFPVALRLIFLYKSDSNFWVRMKSGSVTKQIKVTGQLFMF